MADVLVTGAEGLIGQALVKQFLANGLDVASLSRRHGDIASASTWRNASDADHVFHLAARSFVPDSWKDTSGFMDTNVLGTQAALEYCLERGAKLTFVSTYLYGAPQQLPVSEEHPVVPSNPYALSKHMGEELCCFYAEHRGVPVTVIRPFNVYGPGQRPVFLIPYILKQIQEGDQVCVKDLEPKRDYVYLDDVVQALIATREQAVGYQVFNIGSGESVSVAEVIDALQDAMGTSLPVKSDNEVRKNEILDVRADITRAYELLNWRPRHSFIEGIGKLVALEGMK